MKKRALLLLSAALSVTGLSQTYAADVTTSFTVLSPADVSTYRDIFAAEKSGQVAKSEALVKELSDTSLVGYVLEERFLGAHYHARFAELKNWLHNYGDLSGADKIYKLAARRAPKGTSVPAPVRAHWRGVDNEPSAFEDTNPERQAVRRLETQLRTLTRQDRPEAAETLWKRASTHTRLTEADFDRLGAFVGTAYLGEQKDKQALSICGDVIAKNGNTALQCHWVSGLASYRLGDYAAAADHFETVVNNSRVPRTYSAAAFWAARSHMRNGDPARVVTLYQRAASEPDTFYGLLALRVLGRDMNAQFADPALDTVSFAQLMQDRAAHRAVAMWQIGRTDFIETELSRAFGEISSDLDPAFAGLARDLGAPSLELRAAEMAAPERRLTSLYPVPPYKPEGGYTVDQAVILAFAKQESRFQPAATSKAGARGVMQIMPQTAVTITHDRSLAGRNKDRLDDPVYNLTLGQNYLQDLLEKQNGNLFSIAAAYNAGEGNLSKWQSQQDANADPMLFIETIPLAETRDYIKRVMTNLWMYRLRLGEPVTGLDDAAGGAWPIYHSAAREAAAH
ncbi:MAG TPA: lytic transglycosylase domain-containing protein [Micropepsaceae bacterium]|nr:lytic transglycosylase domain-containing protein [Micropepsaceae bacterium]